MVSKETIKMVAEEVLKAPFFIVTTLFQIQTKLNKKHKWEKDEVSKRKLTSNVDKKPEYDERNAIINNIPDFWLTVFSNHHELGDNFTDEDRKIFKHLISLEVEGGKSDYSFTFKFKANAYFKNDSIVKRYKVSNGKTTIEITPVQWKKRSMVPKGVTMVNKRKKGVCNDISFFTWFCPWPEDEENLGDKEFADIIKNDIWPNPLRFLHQDVDDEDDEDDQVAGDDEVQDNQVAGNGEDE